MLASGRARELGAANSASPPRFGALPYYGLSAGFLIGKYRTAADWSRSSRVQAFDRAAAEEAGVGPPRPIAPSPRNGAIAESAKLMLPPRVVAKRDAMREV